MAHLRKRYLHSQILKALTFSPIVGVIGQRQTGKTTLCEEILPNYLTLDDDETRLFAQSQPKGFIESFDGPQTIDECQKAPGLFSALKLRIQKNKRPGQFLLTGSVRFTSRKAIQESLTGRIFNLELLPLTLSEAHHLDLNDFIKLSELPQHELQLAVHRRTAKINSQHIDEYIRNGGLPGICFLRDRSHIKNRFKAHIETLLQRDFQMVTQTTIEYDKLLSFLKYLAVQSGLPFVISDCSRAIRMAPNTIKKTLFGFESLFLIRKLQGFGFLKKQKYFFEDLGMSWYLNEPEKTDLNHFLLSQIFAQSHYLHPHNVELGYITSRSGETVPLVVKTENQQYGFIVLDHEAVTPNDEKKAKLFFDTFKKGHFFYVTMGTSAFRISRQVTQIPLRGII